jgi:hypothetical protein
MADRLYILFILIALFVFALAGSGPLKKRFGDRNGLDFSISEDEHTLRAKAYYPYKSSFNVESYVKSRFKAVNPNEYIAMGVDSLQMLDSTVSFTIHTRDGFLELTLEKDHNSESAQAKFRDALKDLERNIGRLTSR